MTNVKELPLEYQIFALSFKEDGAIVSFSEELKPHEVCSIEESAGLREFYQALLDYHQLTKEPLVNPIAFRSWLETSRSTYEAIEAFVGIDTFMETVLSLETATVNEVIAVVKDRYKTRQQINFVQELQAIINSKEHKTEQDLDKINKLTVQISELQQKVEYNPLAQVKTANDLINSMDDMFVIPPFLSTPFKSLNVALGYNETAGMFRGAVHAVVATSGKGKALALDTPIPTPGGWVKMGDIKPGDKVFGSDGSECNVVAVSPIFYNHDCFSVKFSDGSKITANAEHLWEIERTSYWGGSKVKTTRELYGMVGSGTIRVPKQGALNTQDIELPIDPYVLGAWLGDGHSAGARITCGDYEVVEEISKTESINHAGEMLYNISEGNGAGYPGKNPFHTRLRNLNLLKNKHIPEIYLRASIDQRLSLLQGLMDTDGSVYINGNGMAMEFCNTNKNLIANTLELIRSLGINASCSESRATLYGKDCGPRYKIRFLSLTPVFRIKRKLERQVKQKTAGYNRTIRSIEATESVPTMCIQVDSSDHLYLAGEGMVPTHNSTIVKAMANHWLDDGYSVLYVNYEEAEGHWNRILLSQILKENVYRNAEVWTAEEKEERKLIFQEHMEQWGDRLMVRHDPDSCYFSDLERWFKDLIGSNIKPDVVIIDTIQSMLGDGKGPRWGDYELMMIKLERLAKEMDAVFIITAQQNNEAVKENRSVAKQSDIGGSVAIVQKCSVIMVLTPIADVVEDESIDENIMGVQILKNRITGQGHIHEPPMVKYIDEYKSYVDVDAIDNSIYDNGASLTELISGGDFRIQ